MRWWRWQLATGVPIAIPSSGAIAVVITPVVNPVSPGFQQWRDLSKCAVMIRLGKACSDSCGPRRSTLPPGFGRPNHSLYLLRRFEAEDRRTCSEASEGIGQRCRIAREIVESPEE